MIKETTELKIRFLILFICFFISTFTLMMCYYNQEVMPYEYTPFTKYIKLDDWNYNFNDNYYSKLENFIIIFGYGVFLIMLIDILMICENDTKNINTRKDNSKNEKFRGNKK
jgi:hypothetical protein